MKKIMFNKNYGLEAAVLKRIKNMTRRMIPQKTVDFILNDFRREYFEATFDRLDDKECIEQYFLVEKIKEPPYKVGEVVAVAQCYSDIHWDCREEWHKKGINLNVQRDGTLKGLVELKGWDNKMFVRADAMPHHIRITDIKVERLQDISDNDCIAEGIKCFPSDVMPDLYTFEGVSENWKTAREAFARLIDKVSGKGTWENNPWVFVYSFELIK